MDCDIRTFRTTYLTTDVGHSKSKQRRSYILGRVEESAMKLHLRKNFSWSVSGDSDETQPPTSNSISTDAGKVSANPCHSNGDPQRSIKFAVHKHPIGGSPTAFKALKTKYHLFTTNQVLIFTIREIIRQMFQASSDFVTRHLRCRHCKTASV